MGREKVEQPARLALTGDQHDYSIQAPEDPQIADMDAIALKKKELHEN